MDLNKTPSENLSSCALTLHTTFTEAINLFDRERKQQILVPPVNPSLPQSNFTRSTLLLNDFMNKNRELFGSPLSVQMLLRMVHEDQSSQLGKALQNCLHYCKDQFIGVTSTTLRTIEDPEKNMLYQSDFPPLLSKSITRMAYNSLDNRYFLSMETHPGSICGYDVYESLQLAATVSNRGTLQVWNFAKSKQILHNEENSKYGTVKFSSDGSLVAKVMLDQEQQSCSIKIWDLSGHSGQPIYETVIPHNIKRIRCITRAEPSIILELIDSNNRVIRCTCIPEKELFIESANEYFSATLYCTDAGKAINKIYVQNNNTLTLEINSTPLLFCLWAIKNTRESKDLAAIKKSRSYFELGSSCLKPLVDEEINLAASSEKRSPYSRTK